MRRITRRVFPLLALLATTVALATAFGPAAAGDPLPAGAFAIGDQNAVVNSQVTFWGAKWWKANTVSTPGESPAFKGYASDVDAATCTFTTRPGNSPPPPDGPLPSVIRVLVTNAVTKSGPTITGKVTGVALVATNGGYDDNPGHAGTGTVVGFSACIPGTLGEEF